MNGENIKKFIRTNLIMFCVCIILNVVIWIKYDTEYLFGEDYETSYTDLSDEKIIVAFFTGSWM